MWMFFFNFFFFFFVFSFSLFDLANQDLPPSWATSSSDGGSASSAKSADDDERELRKSVDVLMMKRSAALDSDSLQSGEDLFSKEARKEKKKKIGFFLKKKKKKMGPDQIGAFVRIGDDGMRSRACNFVVSLLKQKIEDRDEAFLSKCVLTIVRLSIESTFSFVREAFQELTDLLRAAQIPNVVVPAETPVVTRWIKREELPSVQEGTNELTKLLLRNIDIMEGRIPHVIVPMAWHPTFLEKWYRTMMHLMRGTGPLLFTWRRYISIVACARFQCMPMLKLQEMDFLACGGDPSWLQGVSAPSLPPKLYALLELNGLLAHQPWKITHSTIEALLSSSIESQWSVGELVHAIAIMVTFHSVSALVWGLGVTPEVDISEALKSETETETAPVPSVPQGSGDTKSVIDILKKGPETFSKERQNWMEAGETTKSNIWAEAEDGAEVSQLLQQQSLSGATSHQVRRKEKKKKERGGERKKKEKFSHFCLKNSNIVLDTLALLFWNMQTLKLGTETQSFTRRNIIGKMMVMRLCIKFWMGKKKRAMNNFVWL